MSTTRCLQKTKWSKAMNIEVMECYYLSNPVDDSGRAVRGYRKRMHGMWHSRGGDLEVSEQRLCDQVRGIKKNGWLSQVEVDKIRRVLGEEGIESEESGDDIEVNVSIEGEGNGSYVHNEGFNGSLAVEDDVPEEIKGVCGEIIKIYDEIEKQNEKYKFGFKCIDRKKLSKETSIGNDALRYIKTINISETNRLISATSVFIARKLGLRNQLVQDCDDKMKWKKPWWKKRLERDIVILRRNISILDQKLKGGLRKEWKYRELVKKFGIRRKGLKVVLEELKQRLNAKKIKIKRYDQRIKQYQQNRLFRVDKKRFYQQINGELRKEKVTPNAAESVRFWEGIWGSSVSHKKNAEWLKEVKKRIEIDRQKDLKIDDLEEKYENGKLEDTRDGWGIGVLGEASD